MNEMNDDDKELKKIIIKTRIYKVLTISQVIISILLITIIGRTIIDNDCVENYEKRNDGRDCYTCI